jgi:hypothetical protein
MKKLFSVLLLLSMIFCFVLPVLAVPAPATEATVAEVAATTDSVPVIVVQAGVTPLDVVMLLFILINMGALAYLIWQTRPRWVELQSFPITGVLDSAPERKPAEKASATTKKKPAPRPVKKPASKTSA